MGTLIAAVIVSNYDFFQVLRRPNYVLKLAKIVITT